MIEIFEEGVLTLMNKSTVVGFVRMDMKSRAPVYYKASKMGFDDLKELHKPEGINFVEKTDELKKEGVEVT